MLQPAHQRGVLARHLHAVDAEVEGILALARRSFGDDQRPGDQRCGLARPAALDRQFREIDILALQHHLLAGRARHRLRLHRHDGLQQRQHLHRLAKAARWLRLAQEGQGLADLAQLMRLAVHPPGHPLHRAEQIDQHRHAVGFSVRPYRILENHRRPLLGQQPGLDLRHLQMGGDRRGDAHQPPAGFQTVDEVTQAGIGHGVTPQDVRRYGWCRGEAASRVWAGQADRVALANRPCGYALATSAPVRVCRVRRAFDLE